MRIGQIGGKKESYVAEDSTGMEELADTTILPFGAFLLSECGVIARWLHPTCTTTMFLHVSQLCEYCLGASLAETNQSDGCIFPYETRGMLDICDGILEVFPWPAMLPVCHHCPPPLWGGSGSFTISRLRG